MSYEWFKDSSRRKLFIKTILNFLIEIGIQTRTPVLARLAVNI